MLQGFPSWDIWIDAEQALFFFAAVGEGDDADGFDGAGHCSPPVWKWALVRTITFMAVTPFTGLEPPLFRYQANRWQLYAGW